MKQAKLSNSINRIMVAGEAVIIRNTDFALYDNGVLVVDRYTSEVFSDISANLPAIAEGNGGETLTINALKHINSTSLSDDYNGTHHNTLAEDFAEPEIVLLAGNLVHPTGSYQVMESFVYYPAVHPPGINVARIAGALRNSSSNYAGMFANAQINELSPAKPNKTVPHSAGELIGYAPKFKPVYLSATVDGTLQLEEGEPYKVVVAIVTINQGKGVSAVNVLDLNCDTTKSQQQYSKELAVGSHSFVNYAIVNGVRYELGSSSYTVVAAPKTLVQVSLACNINTRQLTLTVNNTSGVKYVTPTVKVFYEYKPAGEDLPLLGDISTTINTLTLPVGQSTHVLTWLNPSPLPPNYNILSVSYSLVNTARGFEVLAEEYVLS